MIEKHELELEKRSYQRLGLCAGVYGVQCASPAVCKHCSRCETHCTCKKGVTRFTPEELGITESDDAKPALQPSTDSKSTRR